LATFLSDPSSKEAAKFQMEEWLSDQTVFLNPTLRIIAAILHMYDDNCREAIKNVRFEKNMEQ
jgi:hypothetical protein